MPPVVLLAGSYLNRLILSNWRGKLSTYFNQIRPCVSVITINTVISFRDLI